MTKADKSLVVIIVLILLGLIGFVAKQLSQPGQYDELAMCLEDKGAMFYGAFWCSHCKDQKELFGKSAEKLPYTECSTEDGQGQIQKCKDKDISSYPTWIFANKEVVNRVMTPAELAEKTACSLPA